MNDLFMQIELFEKDLNRTTCFDDIIKIIKDKQHFYIENINGWHACFLITEDIKISIEFTEPMNRIYF